MPVRYRSLVCRLVACGPLHFWTRANLQRLLGPRLPTLNRSHGNSVSRCGDQLISDAPKDDHRLAGHRRRRPAPVAQDAGASRSDPDAALARSRPLLDRDRAHQAAVADSSLAPSGHARWRHVQIVSGLSRPLAENSCHAGCWSAAQAVQSCVRSRASRFVWASGTDRKICSLLISRHGH